MQANDAPPILDYRPRKTLKDNSDWMLIIKIAAGVFLGLTSFHTAIWLLVQIASRL